MATYLVTGCGRGIGLAMTKALLARGGRVIGTVRNGQPPEESAAGMIKVIDELTIERTGRFMNWDGTERSW
jgi:NAD(P)-dependent dehydrogenase (short-subunit alcohol dehydrogenase family)